MTQSEYQTYVRMCTKDRREFHRWLSASVVVGSIFAAAVVIMAVGSSKAPGPDQAATGGTPGTEISASARHSEPTETLSPYELTIRIAPHQLPVQQVDEPF
jgi:hypothetical protein